MEVNIYESKLNVEAFSEDFRKIALMECAVYLFECLEEDEKEKIRDDWNKVGGYVAIPWWKWCMEHIKVSYAN